jgi:hypothetical protein
MKTFKFVGFHTLYKIDVKYYVGDHIFLLDG